MLLSCDVVTTKFGSPTLSMRKTGRITEFDTSWTENLEVLKLPTLELEEKVNHHKHVGGKLQAK